MKNFPIWLAKLLLVVLSLLYWEVPQWIFSNSQLTDPPYRNKAIGFRACGQLHPSVSENERFRMLEDSLQKDIDGVNIETITFDTYFQILWKHDERSKRFGFQGGTTGFTWTNFQAKSDRYLRVRDDWPSKLETARDKYRDIYEPGWKEKEKRSTQEWNEFVDSLPTLILRIYWFNIIFCFFWYILSYRAKKRDGDLVIFNPVSIALSSLIWPYFFFRSISRAWLQTHAEIELRATKVNPFSLLSIDERALIKKFAQSVRFERKEIIQSIRKGKRHSVSFALCATLCVRILPLYATCVPVIDAHIIECSISENQSADHAAINHDVGWMEKCEVMETTPWKPFPVLSETVSFFIFSQKCLRGVRRKLDHIPLWNFILIVCINLKLHIKKYLYEKNKNHGSTLPSHACILRTRQSCAA